MRRLYAMIRNEFLREFASPMQLVFFLILPLLFTAAVGAGLSGMMGGGDTTPQEVRYTLSVVSADSGPLVEAFLDALAQTNVTPQPVTTLPEESFALELPADFSRDLLAGETVTLTLHILPQSSATPAIEQAVRAAQGRVGGVVMVARMGVEQAQASGVITTADESAAFFTQVLEQTLADTRQPPAVAQVRWPEAVMADLSGELATSTEQASAGQLVTWVQITLLGAAEVLVDERLRGTLRRLLMQPTSRGMIFMGKLVSRLLLGLLQMAILLLGGSYLFGVNWGQDLPAVALVSLAFALALVAMGMMLATWISSRGQASSLVVGLAMAMSALGGAWFPLEVTPPLYRQVVQVLPSTWAMRAYTDLLVRSARIPDVLPYIGVLLGFAVVFLAVGLVRFRQYE